MTTYFADVVLPLHLPGTLTYRVPQEYNDAIQVGQRVVVQVGPKKLYAALVRRIHQQAPEFTTKYLQAILDEQPIVGEQQFVFWEWMADYYMCYIGDVMAIALPSSLRIASESILSIHPDYDGELSSLTANENKIVMLLNEHPSLSVADIQHAIGVKNIMPILGGMIERHIVMMDEDLKQRFTPRTTAYLLLHPKYQPNGNDDNALQQLVGELENDKRKEKRLAALLRFLQLSHFGADAVKKKLLADDKSLSLSSINTLIKNEVLIEEQRIESRLEHYDESNMISASDIQLSDCQQQAFDALHTCSQKISLLHGVTSSGKTEVYIKIIDEIVQQGKQALFLLPEIALTTQLINRLRRYFGNKVGVYHSRFSASQRTEVWHNTLSMKYQVLIGARSAIFLPFQKLGIVVVDEEHDASYKQYEPSPRYQARDSAIMLAHQWKARTILGSATPSVESYFNATTGKYSLAVMDKRYGGVTMPEVLCADMKEASRRKEVNGHFSHFLINHIDNALKEHQQVILFQNRRGFSIRLTCDDCQWTPQCRNCDVSMVYHKSTNSLRCHYCGYSIPIPTECPACHSHHISMKGIGTERIEEDLSLLFPDAKVARMDLDSTSQKNKYLELISDFEEHRIDILVGTQMVTKGLDFENVSIVGIISADSLIFFPEFRAYERAYQLMTQVSGRAGRHQTGGKVIIQTYNPYHQAIRDVIDNNYQRMYESQKQERRIFRYPPYNRLIYITMSHRDQDVLNTAAAVAAQQLRMVFGNRVMGPEYPSIPRIRGMYLKQIMLRFERTDALSAAKQQILVIFDAIEHDKQFRPLKVIYDVDPN